ncbi:NAD-binding protein [Laetiporus sulphureus 93-53]|uniref:D-xylose 1-dehydrogenase (NADP(+), D-xylono-1,5-lactone-forming) n=1 Tax=Laetiporus sulphureus 93-53 TaxID=1314785 RepID=A0A165GA79_9APHY|nr:NAD-binding protein [Laetiporus sulphureus 93-53]KZT10058.1 NAD-binding protein [Laetiporus sulphureus 93-53]
MASIRDPFVLHWGVVSTGWIAEQFVKDCVVDPKTRGTTDVVHQVVAVGSRNGEVHKAQAFIDTYAPGKNVKAYGTYEEVYADPEVNVIYIGSPHAMHFENAMAALNAGKHVLCEKAVTLNAAELRKLLSVAEAKNLFFMEALWTRFQPLVKAFKQIAEDGSLGDPIMLHADFSHYFDMNNLPTTHRMLDPRLGGGGLLDLGPYPMFWAVLALYEHPSNKRAKPTSVTASMIKTPRTGVDISTSWTLNFTSTLRAQANLSCSATLPSPEIGATIRYQKGTITVGSPLPIPSWFQVQWFDSPDKGNVVREEKRMFHYVGGGWHFQADEVARCVRDGKIESDLWSHDKSLLLMETFDEVRYQGNYMLPEGVEKVLLNKPRA